MKLVDRMRFHKVPGVSIAVVNNGKIEWAKGFGVKDAATNEPVTANTIFQAASISKPIAAMATLRLIQENKLGLDDEANSKLISWKIPDNEFTRDKKVTVRHLLNHTSGLTNTIGSYDADAVNIPSLPDALSGTSPLKPKTVRVEFVPGSKFNYSGGGYSVLQQLIVDVTGRPFDDYLNEKVLRPLGMKNSHFYQPLPAKYFSSAASGHKPNGEVHPLKWRTLTEAAAGGLWSTPSDLARFIVDLQSSARGKSGKILTSQSARQMLTPQMKNWGLGVMLDRRGGGTSFSHNGWNPGYRSLFIAFRDTGHGAVVMTNGDSNGTELIWEIVRGIATEYEWPEHRVSERTLASVDTKIYGSLAGEYEVEKTFRLTVSNDDGRLFISGGPFGRAKTELFPQSADSYFVLSADVNFSFVKDDSGSVTELAIDALEGRRTAKRTPYK